jgi:hypothetical protein
MDMTLDVQDSARSVSVSLQLTDDRSNQVTATGQTSVL